MKQLGYIISFLILLAISVAFVQMGKPVPAVVNFQPSADTLQDTFANVRSPFATRLDSFFYAKHLTNGFNGSVIIAKGGRIYYKGNFGIENQTTGKPLTEKSSFQIASISKTFTATAILYLIERGNLSLENKIEDFIPDFPYKNITVSNLLCHRSGLPNYLHFGGKYFPADKYMTNDDLIEIMKKNPNIEGTYKPDTRFQYCNTNYAILATIVEQVSGKKFPEFMQDNFFIPLGMKNSWIYDPVHTASREHTISYNSRWVVQNDDSYDGVYGDKGVYSSTEDMLRWDMHFYQNKSISQEMQTEAYSPRSFEKPGYKNYGYGWRLLKQTNNQYLVYHNGWWHGNNTVFYRYLPDTFSLIILSNKYNRSVYDVQPIFNIISGTNNNTQFTED